MQLLTTPYSLGEVRMPNRLVFPPISTGYGTSAGKITPELIGYYARIAEGGVGTIIIEATAVSPVGKLHPLSLGIWEDGFVDDLAFLTEAIKSKGASAFIQLNHAGPRAGSKINGQQPISVSELPLNKQDLPRKMTTGDIRQMIDQFVQAAKRARRAGLDGIELHGAHFYLLSCFLSPFTNNRDDEYGGDITGRTKVLREIIAGIRQEIGDDFTVICRINGEEMPENGIHLPEAKEIARQLAGAGAAALHVSACYLTMPGAEKFMTVPATSIPGPEDPSGAFIPLAKGVKEAANLPVIAVGKITDGKMAEGILAEGAADLVAIGRPLVADPDFPKKIIAGENPAACLYCRNCIFALGSGKPMTCKVNHDLPGSNSSQYSAPSTQKSE
jgi:2,4-dienoyl-CoA reductase-like NADH-dependent reductase (Old Yellow Enzyme family)